MAEESLPVSGAARMLGLSPKTVKRLCREGKLPYFETPGGHFRFRRADLESFAKGGSTPAAAGLPRPSTALQSQRERIDELRLKAEELRAQRELRRIEAEDEEVEGIRKADAEAASFRERQEVERLRLESEREVTAREQSAREDAARRRRSQWLAAWTEGALTLLPDDVPSHLAVDVRQTVADTLADEDPDEPETLTARLVHAAMGKALAPWRRSKEIDKIIEESARQLPTCAKSWDRRRPSEWETRTIRAASEAIDQLQASAPLAEIRSVAFEAVKSVCEEYERRRAVEDHRETCKSVLDGTIPPFELPPEERGAAEHAVREALAKLPNGCGRSEMLRAKDAALAPFEARVGAMRTAGRYLEHVAQYVEKLGNEETGEWDLGDFLKRRRLAEKLKVKIRPRLIQEIHRRPDMEEEEIHWWIEDQVDGEL